MIEYAAPLRLHIINFDSRCTTKTLTSATFGTKFFKLVKDGKSSKENGVSSPSFLSNAAQSIYPV